MECKLLESLCTTPDLAIARLYLRTMVMRKIILRMVEALLLISGMMVHVQAGPAIWITKAEIDRLPMSGDAWDNMHIAAQKSTENPDLGNQDEQTDTDTMAKALVYARSGVPRYADEVRSTLQRLVENNPISRSRDWVALAALRALGSYTLAADLIDLQTYDPEFEQEVFRPWLSAARFAVTEGGRGSIVELQELRPNNFGTHGSASRIAINLYLNDRNDLERAAKVFKGWLGDRSSYAEFKYGELSWQMDEARPVGINPKGSTRNGHNIDGVLPDDARRCGSFRWPPCKTGYLWEGLQGAVTAAEMLHRAGYPAFEWEDRAILRAVEWLYNTNFNDGRNYPAEGDDRWLVWVINKRYGTNYPVASPVTPGKMIGWTDWTHSIGNAVGIPLPPADLKINEL